MAGLVTKLKERKQETEAGKKQEQASSPLQTSLAKTKENGASAGMPLFLQSSGSTAASELGQVHAVTEPTKTPEEEGKEAAKKHPDQTQNSQLPEALQDTTARNKSEDQSLSAQAINPPAEGEPASASARAEASRNIQEKANQVASTGEPGFAQSVEIQPPEAVGISTNGSKPAVAASTEDGKAPVTSALETSLKAAQVPELESITTSKETLGKGDTSGAPEVEQLVTVSEKKGSSQDDNEAAVDTSTEQGALGGDTIMAAASEGIDLASAEADTSLQLTTLSDTATVLNSLGSTSIQFAPNEQETNSEAETSKASQDQRFIAEGMATEFLARNAGQLQAFVAIGQTVPDRMLAAALAAKTAIDASVAEQHSTVSAFFAGAKARARSAAAGARSQVMRQHQATIPILQAATTAAKTKAEKAHKSALDTLSSHETKQIAKIHSLYADGDRIFRAAGKAVGDKALKKGREKEQYYLGRKIHRDDNVWDGPLTDDKMDASANVAVQVGEGYQKSLVEEANKQANEAQKGKSKDLSTASEAAKKERETLASQLKAALEGLDKSETQAIATADTSKTSMVQAVNGSLATTLKALTALESTELARLTAYGEQQKLAIERDANLAIASLTEGTNQATTTLSDLLSAFVASAGDTPAPDQEGLLMLLADSQAQFDAVSTMLMQQLEEGIQSSEQGIGAGGTQTVEALNTLGQNAIAQGTTTIDEFASGMSSTSQSAVTAFRQMQTSHTKSSEASATAADQGFNQITKGIETRFDTDNQKLEQNFKNSAKALEDGLEQQGLSTMDATVKKEADKAAAQVQPRWKSVLKVLLVIAVIVVVALVAGPAVIGAVGAFAGTLGASAAAASAIGTIVGGAIVGAAAGAVIQIGNNVIDGERSLSGIFKGVGTAMAVGAIGGALGGAGAVLGKAAGSLFSSGLGKLIVDTGINMLGDIGGNIVGDLISGNPITWKGVLTGAAIGIGAAGAMGGLGKLGSLGGAGKLGAFGRGLSKVGTKLEGIQTKASGVGEGVGKTAGTKVKGAFTKPEVPTVKPTVEAPVPKPATPEAPAAPKPVAEAPAAPKPTPEAPTPTKAVAEAPTAKPTAEQPAAPKPTAEQPAPPKAQPEAAEPPKATPEAEGVPPKSAKDQEILDETAPKKNIDLTQEDLNAELDVVAKAKPKPIAEGDYDAEVDLGNGHKWKRQKETGAWCRHSPDPTSCTLPQFGPKHPDMKVEMKPKAEIEAEVKAKTQAEAEVKPKLEDAAEVKPEPKAKTEAEVKPKPELEEASFADVAQELKAVPEGKGPLVGRRTEITEPVSKPTASELPTQSKKPKSPEEIAHEKALVEQMQKERIGKGLENLKDAPDLKQYVESNKSLMPDKRTTLKDLAADTPDTLKEMWSQWKQRRASGEIKTDDFAEYVKARSRSEFKGKAGEHTQAFERGPNEIMIKAPKADVNQPGQPSKAGVNEPGTDMLSFNVKEDRIKLIDNKAVKERVSKVSALEENLPKNLEQDIKDIQKDIQKYAQQPGVPPEINGTVLPRLQAAKADIDAYIKANPDKDLKSLEVQQEFNKILSKHKIDRIVTTSSGGTNVKLGSKLQKEGFIKE
jgi:hypothetical protein